MSCQWVNENNREVHKNVPISFETARANEGETLNSGSQAKHMLTYTVCALL